MVPDFVTLIVVREVSRADVWENNIAATTVSPGTHQLVASVRVSVQNDKFALTGKPRADVFDKCVKVQRADVRARAGAVAARPLDGRPRCRQPVKHGRIPCLGALFRTTRSRDTDERACRTGDLNPERGHAGHRALTRRGLVERTRSAVDGRGQQTLIAAYPPQLQSVRTRVMAYWLTIYGGQDPSVRQRSGTGRWSGV